MIVLDHASTAPLYDQIYRQIKEGIVSGEYPLRSKLPSIRQLMGSLKCSRNTVETAYRMLVQEGYARSQPGSGYIVEDYSRFILRKKGSSPASLPDAGSAEIQDIPVKYNFAYGPLQPGTFPASTWRMLTNEVLLDMEESIMTSYTQPQGELCLRREIARLVFKQRGISCSPDQVFVGNGAQPAIHHILSMFDPVQDCVAMEEPGYHLARNVFQTNRFQVKPCTVMDGRDAFVEQLRASNAKLAYLTPSCQFPTGLCLSMRQRHNILDWARQANAYIIEDDYCYEFQYTQGLLPSLYSMDADDRVIYMGTFSKSLSPALRMNYLVAPLPLAERLREANRGHLGAACAMDQHVVARYIRDGYWDRHLRKLQTLNTKKHDMMISCLQDMMGDRIELLPSQASLHLLVNVKDGRSQAELMEAARKAGVRVYDTNRYWTSDDHPLKSCMLLGFSAIKPEEIEPGIRALASAWFE